MSRSVLESRILLKSANWIRHVPLLMVKGPPHVSRKQRWTLSFELTIITLCSWETKTHFLRITVLWWWWRKGYQGPRWGKQQSRGNEWGLWSLFKDGWAVINLESKRLNNETTWQRDDQTKEEKNHREAQLVWVTGRIWQGLRVTKERIYWGDLMRKWVQLWLIEQRQVWKRLIHPGVMTETQIETSRTECKGWS